MVNLRLLRKNLNKTQKQVADYLGINRVTYTNYENGARQPDFEIMKKLATYFNVSVDYLLDREDSAADNRQELIFTDDEIQIIKKLRTLDAATQKIALNNINNTLDNYQKLTHHTDSNQGIGSGDQEQSA